MAKYNLTYQTVADLSTQAILMFQEGLNGYETVYSKIIPTYTSNTRANTYPLGSLPNIKEWFNKRELKRMEEKHYTLVNRKFESSLIMLREDIEDDQTGFYDDQAKGLGQEAAQHPDHLLADALMLGFSDKGIGYDGVSFFSDAHKWGDKDTALSNLQDGTKEPWFMIDNTKAAPALFRQERVPYVMEKPAELSEHTFNYDEYTFGIRGRSAIGYGLWQLAFGSRDDLNEDNFIAAMESMMGLKKANKNFVGATPKILIVGPSNYAKALKMFTAQFINGTDNVWYNRVQVVCLLGLNKELDVMYDGTPDDEGGEDIEDIKSQIATLIAKLDTVEATVNEAKTTAKTANNKKAKDITVDPAVEGKNNVQDAVNEAKTTAKTANNKKAKDITVDLAVEGKNNVQDAVKALSDKGTK